MFLLLLLLLLLRVGHCVFTDTLLAPGKNSPFFVQAQQSGGFGRFMASSDSESSANVKAEPCVVDGRFCHVMFTKEALRAHTELRWFYGGGHRLLIPTKCD